MTVRLLLAWVASLTIISGSLVASNWHPQEPVATGDVSCQAVIVPQSRAAFPRPRWRLSFREDFSGTRLDTAIWTTCYQWVDPAAGCTNFGNADEQAAVPALPGSRVRGSPAPGGPSCRPWGRTGAAPRRNTCAARAWSRPIPVTGSATASCKWWRGFRRQPGLVRAVAAATAGQSSSGIASRHLEYWIVVVRAGGHISGGR